MTFKIWHKLALILILTITIAVVISTVLSQRSFKKSFLEYIEQQQQRQLENLAQNLLNRYEEEGNWAFIRDKKRVWFFYQRLKPEQRKRDRARNENWQQRQARKQEEFDSRQERNLIRALPVGQNGKKFNKVRNKIALLDENKKLIVGALLSKENTEYYPLKSNGHIVAYIQRVKFMGITDQLDKIFANKQEQAFLFNTMSTLFISVLVALFISIYFRKRLHVLTHFAEELTSGHYQERVDIKQKDELGQLGMDFNVLARTLQKNQQSQQQWIADISHELRTPLAILKGELQALDDGIRPLNQDAVNSLKQETDRLGKLVEDIYQLSVADMGALKYDKKPFVFSELFIEINDNFSSLFKQKELKLTIDCDFTDAFLFNGDKLRLHQLMSNLLQNSLHYTNSGGQVIIQCLQNEKSIKILISDSEPGVEPEKITQIFDRLFRVESSRSRSKGGAGLGLAIAKQIVLAHQGDIYAQPSELGGITISMVFPV
ncbi:MAG: ATP-binding protein [Gammaproteobacteria bacterium]|nr:ATP-binding protein [Gammaproteobacteria bacterium]